MPPTSKDHVVYSKVSVTSTSWWGPMGEREKGANLGRGWSFVNRIEGSIMVGVMIDINDGDQKRYQEEGTWMGIYHS